MKTKLNVYTLIAVVVICMIQGCTETKTSYEIGIGLPTENANFVVTNTTTGESAENQGELNDPDRLIIHTGDVLELSYTPKEENERYNWEVIFDLAGERIPADNSYTARYTVTDLTPGRYTITCTSEAREDINDEEYYRLRETGYVYVEMVTD